MPSDAGIILVVDDIEENRDLLCRRLGRRGYTTVAAIGGYHALEMVSAQHFDVILLDIMMPDLDGLSVLKTLRQTYSASELPIIMVTAKDESTDIVEALKLGANDYVTKPVDFPVALARIQNQLSRKRAEEALHESEERYALAMNGANDGLWDWNLDTNDMYFSPRWYSMLGLPASSDSDKPDTWFGLVHPEDRAQLQDDISLHCRNESEHFENEHRMMHSDGSYRWMLSRGLAVRDANGHAYRMAGSLTDVTERKVVDGVTGLPNRLLLLDRLGSAIERQFRQPNCSFAVLFLDLDRFRVINDSRGTSCGDQLLVAVSQRLGDCLRSGDSVLRVDIGHTMARLGGDEFAILLNDITDASHAIRIAERLQVQLAEPFDLDGQEMFITASIGITLGMMGYTQPEDVIRDAEIAMTRAKGQGTGRYEVFDIDMHKRAMTRLQAEIDLRQVIGGQGLHLYYQPIVSLRTGKISGFEALVRWEHPERGLISPVEFIPLAEETGLILPIGLWILQEACHQMQLWQEQFPTIPPLFISINLSGKQFDQADLVAQMGQILRETGLEPSSVKLEITETVLMDNAEIIASLLNQLRTLGCQLSLDDFGTGYSSLSYLHQFPIDTLKIDRSFVSRIGSDNEGSEIVRTILTLAHNFNMDVVAEGVETPQQMLYLKELGCEYGQGYFMSKPMDSKTAEALLAAEPQW